MKCELLHNFLRGKTGYLLGFIGSFAALGLALAIQVRYELNPCPLCISQRMVLMVLGVQFLLAAFIKPASHLAKFFVFLQALTTLIGAGVAIRHWWLQAHRDEMIADCGVGFDYMFKNFPLEKALKLIFRGTGDCASIDWTFLGLSIPQISLIVFVGMAFYIGYLAILNASFKNSTHE